MFKNFTEDFVMRTAVQLRDDDDVHAYTMLGQVATKKAGTKGEIALFDDGQLVLYIKENKNRKDACLFQTDTKKGTETIAGVYPAVNLFLETRTKGKTRRLLNYVAYMEKNHIPIQGLREGFFYRMQVLLDGRNAPAAEFKELLRRWAS